MEIPVAHAHTVGIDASADLINTLELDADPQEHLPSADDAIRFLLGRDLAHEADLRRQLAREGDDAWLARVRETRAALREVWDAQVEGRAPAGRALSVLNGVLDRGPRVELRPTLAGIEVAHRHPDDDPTGEALARIAAPLIEAIASGHADRFRICANDDCRWVFEDASRARRRRWCDMATCGNRAKVQRYRSRRRDGAAEDAEDADRTA